MTESGNANADAPKRVRWTLLALLWVWAILVFVVVDLFFDVEEFDRVRPRATLYQGVRSAAHEMVGKEMPAGVRTVSVVATTRRGLTNTDGRPVVKNGTKTANGSVGASRMPPKLRTDDTLSFVEHGTYTQWNDPGPAAGAGEYEAGRRVGKWGWSWPDGTKREERNYEKGLLHGRVESWYEDGAKERLEIYEKNQRTSTWEAWYSSGALAAADNYEGGKPHGEFKRWYGNGQQAAERRFQRGVAEGAITVWHNNGQHKLNGQYVGGKKDGRWSHFDDRGNLVREETYRDGKRIPTGPEERKDRGIARSQTDGSTRGAVR